MDPQRQFCHNPDCPDRGRVGQGARQISGKAGIDGPSACSRTLHGCAPGCGDYTPSMKPVTRGRKARGYRLTGGPLPGISTRTPCVLGGWHTCRKGDTLLA